MKGAVALSLDAANLSSASQIDSPKFPAVPHRPSASHREMREKLRKIANFAIHVSTSWGIRLGGSARSVDACPGMLDS